MREKNARLFALDTVGIAKEVSSRADLQQRMQGIVLLGIFLRVTPFQPELRLSDEAVVQGRRKVAAQVLRQARRTGGAGQPEGRAARLSRSDRSAARSHAGDRRRRRAQRRR